MSKGIRVEVRICDHRGTKPRKWSYLFDLAKTRDYKKTVKSISDELRIAVEYTLLNIDSAEKGKER